LVIKKLFKYYTASFIPRHKKNKIKKMPTQGAPLDTTHPTLTGYQKGE
jgi:hypothetical protein